MYQPGHQGPFVDPNSNIYRNYQQEREKENVSPSDGAPHHRRFVLNPFVPFVLVGIAGILAVVALYFLLFK